MTKAELMRLVGKYMTVVLYDGQELTGILEFIFEFSEKYGFRKPGVFYIGNHAFRVSHVKKVIR